MAVVAGVVFFAIRAPFTLLPAFANRHAPSKNVQGACLLFPDADRPVAIEWAEIGGRLPGN